jgi:hypothetical protein
LTLDGLGRAVSDALQFARAAAAYLSAFVAWDLGLHTLPKPTREPPPNQLPKSHCANANAGKEEDEDVVLVQFQL